MNEKKNIQQIAEILTKQSSFPRKTVEAFVRALSDTIVEALMVDGFVRVKGLGTFKIVEVESRESVNIQNGERFTIPSFRKISFLPEDAANEAIQAAIAEQPVESSETPEVETVESENPVSTEDNCITENSDSSESTDEIKNEESPVSSETVIEESSVPAEPVIEETPVSSEPVVEEPPVSSEPVIEETPADEFSGIDLLISTPESVADMHEQLLEVQQKRDAVYGELAEAQRKVDGCRDQKKQAENDFKEADEQRRQAEERAQFALNAIKAVDVQLKEAESVVETCQSRADDADAEVKRLEQMIQNVDNNTKPVIAPLSLDKEPAESEKDVEKEITPSEPLPDPFEIAKPKPKRHYRWVLWLILLLLLAGGVVFYYLYQRSAGADKQKNVTEQTVVPTQPDPKEPTAKPEQPKPTDVPAPSAATPSEKDSVVPPKPEEQPLEKPVEKPVEKPAVVPEPAEPARPTTYVLKRGESLTRVSQIVYGTKDSVRAIIRVNKFKDPNNVPAGATIKLP